MTPGYLFSDSEPFPVQYDFLATLKGFLSCAGRVGRLRFEIVQLEKSLAKDRVDREKLVAVVREFCDGVTSDVHARIGNGPTAEVLAPFGSQVIDSVSSVVDEVSERMQRENKESQAYTESEMERRWAEIRRAVAEFFSRNTFTVTSYEFAMRLTAKAAALEGRMSIPGGIEISFELDPDGATLWSRPLRVQDLVDGLELHVGLKKKFLSRQYTPEVVSVGEYTVTQAEVSATRGEIHLRRRADSSSGDAFIVRFQRAGGGPLQISLVRFDAGQDQGEQPVDPADVPKLTELWSRMQEEASVVLPYKGILQWVRVDGEDVFASERLFELLDRLIDQFAPLVSEISRRSPNRNELSLKRQLPDGRREEIYVSKAELIEPLADLPEPVFERFAILDVFPDDDEAVVAHAD